MCRRLPAEHRTRACSEDSSQVRRLDAWRSVPHPIDTSVNAQQETLTHPPRYLIPGDAGLEELSARDDSVLPSRDP
jgi:hypothetical protein